MKAALRGIVWMCIMVSFVPAVVQAERIPGPGSQGFLVVDQAIMRMFSGRFEALIEAFPDPIYGAADKIAFEHGLPPKLVRAVIRAESNGNPAAVSPKGAMGLMQLMPETAKEQQVSNPFDPLANIRGGVRYLKKLLEEFSGDLSLALAAYNAGPGKVRKYQGVPPYPETRQFIQRVKDGFSGTGQEVSAEQNTSKGVFPLEKISGRISFHGSPRELALFLKRIRTIEATERME